MVWYIYCMTYGVLDPTRQADLDGDQTAALRRFLEDLNAVLTEAPVSPTYRERLVRGLGAAYYAALVAGSWHFFIGLLSTALEDLQDAGFAPRARAASPYWRLSAMVRENADLLPPEMLRIG